MNLDDNVTSVRVADEAGRRAVVPVLRATYYYEKHWVANPGEQIPRPVHLAHPPRAGETFDLEALPHPIAGLQRHPLAVRSVT